MSSQRSRGPGPCSPSAILGSRKPEALQAVDHAQVIRAIRRSGSYEVPSQGARAGVTPGSWLGIVEPDRPPGRCSGADSPVTGRRPPGGRQMPGAPRR